MNNLSIEKFKKEGFTYEEIESVKRWLEDVAKGRVYTEEDFYAELDKTIFSKKNRTYV